MKYYDAKVRLGGSLLNEVWCHGISAPEVMLLNAIHGGSAIADLAENKKVSGDKAKAKISPRKLRSELTRKYGSKKVHMDAFNGLFGPGAGQALPEEVSMNDFKAIPDDEVESEDETEVVPTPAPSEDEKPNGKADGQSVLD
ncbi:MAG: hypothetical protein AAGF53_02320 [Pseudomonadota bacterium]